MPGNFTPLRFIEEPIQVHFDQSPVLEKKPGCPQSFIWRGETFNVKKVISEWRDYERHGRMSRNMSPAHATVASRRGSWGVGVFYFRVETEQERIFDLYYDRSPKNVDQRKGEWFLYQELVSD